MEDDQVAAVVESPPGAPVDLKEESSLKEPSSPINSSSNIPGSTDGTIARQQSSSADDDDSSSAGAKRERTTSGSNVFPIGKLKNGASTAGRLFGSTFKKVKETSSKGWESAKNFSDATITSAKSSKAGTSITTSIEKLKETEAVKKTTGIANKGWEAASTATAAGWEATKHGASSVASTATNVANSTTAAVASSTALEKARAGASAGLSKAKETAVSGIDAVKSKTGKEK